MIANYQYSPGFTGYWCSSDAYVIPKIDHYHVIGERTVRSGAPKRLSMRRISICVIAVALSGLTIGRATNAHSSDPSGLELELRAVLHQRWAALARNDAEAYGAFLDDAILIPDNGSIYNKKALMDRARHVKEGSSEPRDVQVHGDKNVAVMVYRTTSHVPYDGKEITEELRVVETYVKRTGRWLLTARVESEIPNENRVPAKVSRDILDTYVGEYEIGPGKIVKVTRDGDKLMEQGPDDPMPVADLPLSADSFFQRDQPGVLRFARSNNGQIVGYVLWIYDSTILGKKFK